MTSGGFEKIPGRFFNSVASSWWAFTIAEKFNLDPRDVKEWMPDDILEALAYIEMTKPKEG